MLSHWGLALLIVGVALLEERRHWAWALSLQKPIPARPRGFLFLLPVDQDLDGELSATTPVPRLPLSCHAPVPCVMLMETDNLKLSASPRVNPFLRIALVTVSLPSHRTLTMAHTLLGKCK